jgi:hypothetical protein
MKWQAVLTTGKEKARRESNLDLGTHNQTLKQLRQLNDRNHHIHISTNA